MRGHLTGHWLNGFLSQVDPNQYPKLEKILDGEAEGEAAPASPQESASNARAWGAWLKAANKKKPKG